MAQSTQERRTIQIKTPLGEDALLLAGMSIREGISSLFSYDLSLAAENGVKVPFQALLGQKIGIRLELEQQDSYRHFGGICSRITQGYRDEHYTSYRMEVVPQLWLLTRRAGSRTFQQMSVPDILKSVLSGLDVAYQLTASYPERDYCVQYRETDFQFISRLMEEEGIFYFFNHGPDGAHTMVVADSNAAFLADPRQPVAEFEHSGDAGIGISRWEPTQELRSGKFTLWDHNFERAHQHLEQVAPPPPPLTAGPHTYAQALANNGQLEIYDYPGGYAQHFDGVSPGGGDQPGKLDQITAEGLRMVTIRQQEELASGFLIEGDGICRTFTAGRRFTLKGHSEGNGDYVVTSVSHQMASTDSLRSGGGGEGTYQNTFTCIPIAQPYRPARTTPRPAVQGPQTAVVTGPAGDEIFTDKYGRVKVLFHWDRLGKPDNTSSCWVRVGTSWAGTTWGSVHIPRVGQEVIVEFEEGDPDRPLITGSVYNAKMMPPYTLPDNKTQSGLKTRSTPGGSPENFNELRFEDKKGSEEIYFHAERDFNRVVENNDTLKVGDSKAPDGSQKIEIWKNRTEVVKTGNEKVTIEKGNRDVIVSTGNDTHTITTGNRKVKIATGNDKLEINKGNRDVVLDMGNDSLKIKMGNQTTKLDLGKSSTEAMQSITLKVGQSSIKVDQMGVTIKGMKVTIDGQVMTEVKGLMTQVKADAILKMGGGLTMIG